MILCSPPSGTLISTESLFSEETSLIIDAKKIFSVVALITCNLLGQVSTPAYGGTLDGFDHANIGNIVNTDLLFTDFSKISRTSTFTLNLLAHPEDIFLLMTDVSTRLVKESKQLDREFALVVEKEFWNLLL